MTETIALTTDLSEDEGPALVTAAALAVSSGARLVTVHATTGTAAAADRLARAASLAARWGSAITHDSMVHSCCDDVADTVLDALRRIGPALVVTGTHGRSGLAQLALGSIAEAVARNVRVPTLLVPLSGPGLADPRTGGIDLRAIVVPAGDRDATLAALDAAAWLAERAGSQGLDVVIAHVEDGRPAPELDLASLGATRPSLRLSQRTLAGPLEQAIASLSRELDACAIVMATRGHDGLADALGGSHTERVLRQVECPVLSVPIVRD